MPGKRKRTRPIGLKNVEHDKQFMSAIVAARSGALGAGQDVTVSKVNHETPSVPLHPQPESADSTRENEEGKREEEEDDEEELKRKASVARTLKFSSWQIQRENILSDNDFELVVRLPKHATLTVVGCFDFSIIKGAITVNGANIGSLDADGNPNQTHRAFVPASHPIFTIRGLGGTNHVRFMSCDIPAPLANLNPLFGNIWYAQLNRDNGRSFSIMTESIASQLSCEPYAEVVPDDWHRAVETCTASPSITLVTGCPASGKSMFAKRLVNRCLTGFGKTLSSVPFVFFLDLDPSQQEYMPNGQISLAVVRDLNLGPDFTHPVIISGWEQSRGNELIRAHPIPTNLAVLDDFYSACVEDLFQTYENLRSRQRLVPLIVKMCGSLYDSNFDHLSALVAKIKPHDLVHLSHTTNTSDRSATRSHVLQAAASRYQGIYHELIACESVRNATRSKMDLDHMRMQSYFHLTSTPAHPRGKFSFNWMPRPLSTAVPWEFCYQETSCRKQDLVGFAMYGEPIESDCMIHVLNGSIVHILVSTSSVVVDAYAKLPRTDKYKLPYFWQAESGGSILLEPRVSQFVCIAMIRGFEVERKMVQVLVPSTHEHLLYTLVPAQTVFVYGCCDTPDWAFQEDGYADMASTLDGRSMAKENKAVWVDKRSSVEKMGYLNVLRRVRKFQT